MTPNIPSADEVRTALAPLTLKGLDALAELSGVPATTIYKIKRGETKNPGVETLRLFMPHIPAVLAARPADIAAQSAQPAPATEALGG
jgi:transcriptional regulator with XRE-family HTH domain